MDDGIFDPDPPCLFSHLKNIGVHEYKSEEEMFMVMKFFHHAVVLEKMVIHWSKTFAWGSEKQKIHEQILKQIPKASEDCEIIFIRG